MDGSEFDYEIERTLLKEKSQHMAQAHAQMNNIRELVFESSNMIYDQGDKLDIIGDDLFTSYKYVETANEELSEASKHQKKARNKRIFLGLLLLLIICAGGAFFFFV